MWRGYSNVTTVNDMGFEFLDRQMGELWAPAASRGDLWLHGFFKFDWHDSFIRVASITKNSTGYNVTRDNATKPYYLGKGVGTAFAKGCRFYAVGSLELLDVPGEYHVDSKTGVLHFLPPTPLTQGSDIIVSVLDSVVTATASHTTWRDMVLSVARKTVFSTASSWTVCANLTISNSGQGCAVISGSNNTIKDCLIFGCGSVAISITSGDTLSLAHGNSSVIGNTLANSSRVQRTYTPSVRFSGCGIRVAKNVITNSPHTAISGYGNDHLFENNSIRHACYGSSDVGAFYVGRSWSQRGNIVRFNQFRDIRATEKLSQQPASSIAFYLDDQMSGYDFCEYGIVLAFTPEPASCTPRRQTCLPACLPRRPGC